MKLIVFSALTFLSLASPVLAGNVDVYGLELQTGKMVRGGQLVSANVVTSFRPLTNKILKDLAVTTISELKKKYPGCQWFNVLISDDPRMLQAGNHLAIAEYKEGKTTITGGVLNDKEIKEYRKEGIPVIKPDEDGISVFVEVSRTKLECVRKGKYITDQELYKVVSKKLKRSVSSIERYHKGVGWYYMAKSDNPL